jgi:AICAR transformylase/IMP cyclohydrolase PurH
MIPDEELSPVATAYARARGGDRMCSYGDLAAVSDTVDASMAKLLKRETSDGLIAPGYDDDALEILKQKKKGKYLVMQIDPDYVPPSIEYRDVMGFRLEEDRNTAKIDRNILKNVVTKKSEIPEDAALSLIVATVALKYTQSNSVCVVYDGQVIGMGAGQQSRVHCTRLACDKADKWFCQQHPKMLELKFKEGLKRADKTNVVDNVLLWDQLSEVEQKWVLGRLDGEPDLLSAREKAEWVKGFEGTVLSSDAFIPFRDNVDRASRSSIKYILQTGGSLRDQDVADAADEYGMVMVNSGLRCFLH